LRVREENAARLREGLEGLGGPLRAARRDPRVTRQAYYALTLHFDPDQAEGVTREQYAAALGAEGCPLASPYAPIYRHPLLNLYDSTSPIPFRSSPPQDYATLRLPVTERVCEVEGLVMMHWFLLGSEAYTGQLLQAIEKVNDRLGQVKAHCGTASK
jgi:dTDP-4-amino-4,6-dideoxygalactose transaminase